MGKDENSDSDFGKSPENNRKTLLSSTEWELNCMKNRFLIGTSFISTRSSFLKSASAASIAMNFDLEDPREFFKKTYQEEVQKYEYTKNNN